MRVPAFWNSKHLLPSQPSIDNNTVGIQMRRFDRANRLRMAVLIAVIIFHLLLGFLVIEANRFQKVILPDPHMAITFLPPSQPSRSSVRKSPAESPSQRMTAKVPEPSMPAPQAPEPSNAITIPNVSWDAEAEAVVRRKTNNEEAEKRRRSLAGPSDSQLDWARNNAPLLPDHHEAGDTERAAGGQVITWVNDKCYWTTSGATSAGMSQTTKVCKDPPKLDDELFKDMRKKLDDRDSTRLP
jgi:cytoskeletal protein RodZ